LQAVDSLESSPPTREADAARDLFEAAVQQARRQGAVMLALRALTSLCRLERRFGPSRVVAAEAADRQLRRLYASITEGRQTPDLLDAASLMKGRPDGS